MTTSMGRATAGTDEHDEATAPVEESGGRTRGTPGGRGERDVQQPPAHGQGGGRSGMHERGAPGNPGRRGAPWSGRVVPCAGSDDRLGSLPEPGFLGGRRPPYAAGGGSTVECMIVTLRRAQTDRQAGLGNAPEAGRQKA